MVGTVRGDAKVAASVGARRALLQRILESEGFAKSDRLCEFLTYICEASFEGKEAQLNEQKIGIEVFGRRADYDASVDGIVRPNASRLRHRLDAFFEGEGAAEPFRITLPRGSYVPRFEPRMPQIEAPLESYVSGAHAAAVLPEVPVASPLDAPPTSAAVVWLGMVCAALLVACAVLLVGRHRLLTAAENRPSAHPLWSAVFSKNEHLTVVPSDTGLVMWEAAEEKTLGLDAYVTGSYRSQPQVTAGKTALDAIDLASRRYTSMVDLLIVKGVTQLAAPSATRIDVHYARDLRPGEMKEGNFILIGAPAANPWLELFDPALNFTFTAAAIKRYTVVNRKPLPGEPAQWISAYDDPSHRVYGVVAFLPNLSGNGHVLLLEGTSMAGTECAWDFLSQDATLLPFLHRIQRKDGSTPHFQIVLECTNLTGTSTQRSLLASRIAD